VIVVVEFEGDRVAGERIYWDHASLLVQVGLIDQNKLPAWGVEVAQKVLDVTRPANKLIERAGW
jgi:carboxymethylenebutenolidase